MPSSDPFDEDFFEDDLPLEEIRRQIADGRDTVTERPRSEPTVVVIVKPMNVVIGAQQFAPPPGISVVAGGAVVSPAGSR